MKIFIRNTFLIVLFFVSCMTAFAQQTDKVYMLNGKTNEGKVTGVGDNGVKFVYKGETLEYELKKSEISKIVFSSGREETFNSPNETKQLIVAGTGDRKGKVAILPFHFTTNDNGLLSSDMQHRVQSDCADSFRVDTNGLTVIDPMQVNAVLAKNGITQDNITAYQPQELAIMLGAQYVVFGSANVTNKGTRSYGSEVNSSKDKYGKTTTKGSSVTTSSGTTTVTYSTDIELRIYSDTGSNIQNASRSSFGDTLDSYKATIKYLVKRTPFGSKAK